jgi:ABC-type glycerol-3-phosphate transport system substrate-binding protein
MDADYVDEREPVAQASITRRELLGSAAVLGAALGTRRIFGGAKAPSLKDRLPVTSARSRESTAEPVTLVVWEQLVSIGAMKPPTKLFTKMYPHITIKWVPVQIHETATKLLAALAAHSGAPDLAFIEYDDMGKFTGNGGAGLENLRPKMTRAPYALDQWWKPALDIATTPSGEIVGLPADYGAEGTFYRRDTFKGGGLPTSPGDVLAEMKTWDDFIALGKKLRKASGKFMVNSGWDVFDIARQQGVQAWFAPDGKPIVDDAQFVAAAELARQVRKNDIDLNPPDLFGYITGATIPSVTSAFEDGDVACTFSAAWEEIVIAAEAPKTVGDWGVTLLPNNARANLGGSYFVLPTQAGHLDEAWLFASFILATKASMQTYLANFKFLPVWKPSYTVPSFKSPSAYFGKQIWLPEFITLADHDPKLVVTPNDSIAVTAVANALVSILNDKANPKNALTKAANSIASQVRRAG